MERREIPFKVHGKDVEIKMVENTVGALD